MPDPIDFLFFGGTVPAVEVDGAGASLSEVAVVVCGATLRSSFSTFATKELRILEANIFFFQKI
jgi:hypothetical protein